MEHPQRGRWHALPAASVAQCVDETTGQAHVTEDTPDEKTLKLLNNTIAEVTAEMEGMRPNTAIRQAHPCSTTT